MVKRALGNRWMLAVPAAGLALLQFGVANATDDSSSSSNTTAQAVSAGTRVLDKVVVSLTGVISANAGAKAAPAKSSVAGLTQPEPEATPDAGAVGFDLGDGAVTRGISGASAAPALAAFGGGVYGFVKDNNTGTRAKTDTYTALAGVDYDLGGGLGVGGAVSFTYGDGELIAQDGDSELKSFMLAPFVSYRLNDNIGFVGTVGYGTSTIEASILKTSTPTKTEADARTYFINAAAVANYQTGSITYGGQANILWAKTFVDGTTDSRGGRTEDSSSRLGRLGLTGKVGYMVDIDSKTSTFLEPYVKVGMEYDWGLSKVTGRESDRTGLVIGGGANLYSGSGMSLTGDVAYTDRDKEGTWQAGLSVRVPF